MTLYRSALATVAMALVPITHAWNIELPPCIEPFKPFVYSGCFQDSNNNALVFRSSLDQMDMTVEKCIADCKGNGFRYAGLEYYGVCFCGATVNGPQLDESKCSFPCSGNKTETCGGDKSLSVWQDPTFSKSPSDVNVDDYKSLGCYTDDSSKGRTLSYPVELDASTFTTKKCLAACEKEGFPFAGVEFGKECWCGVVLANDTAKVDDTQCNMPCQGDSASTCGGRGRLSLWVAKDLESLEPCGHKPGTTTTPLPPVSTTTTKPIDTSTFTKPVDTTTTCLTDTTTTKPADTTTTKPGDVTTTKPADTTTTKPGDVTTTTTKPVDTVTTSKPTDTTTSTKPEDNTTTTSLPPVTTTTTKPIDTTTSTKPVDTTTTKSADTTTTKPHDITTTRAGITTKPTTTTKEVPHTTTDLCTATVTLPPKCEWQCGSWCAPPLPTWGDKNECTIAHKTCHKQISSCFKNAGWPGAVECFKFKAWCGFIDAYCASSCPSNSCGKWDCWNKHHGGGGKPPGNAPSTTTSVYPCPAISKPVTTTTKPATSCPPEPTNVCTQPTNQKYGYAPGKPVGGIPLPVVGCNDCQDEFDEKPFKYYTEAESRNCPGFPWRKWPSVCSQACKEQYTHCVDTYNKGCQSLGWKDDFYKRAGDFEVSKRWSWPGSEGSHSCAAAGSVYSGAWSAKGSDSVQCWGWGGNNPTWALERCKTQYRDCLRINERVNPKEKCKRWPGC